MLFTRFAAFACFACGVFSSPSRPRRQIYRKDASPTTAAPPAQSTICGDIIDEVNEGANLFYASDAYACLTSVPFNSAVATRFINYLNTTYLFQSTLAYLKNPPQGYQQPAVDLLHGLEIIQRNVTAGYYTNQYAFEADLQLLLYATHDAHVVLQAGILSAFSFASPLTISSVSSDGKEAPKVYNTDDIIYSPQEGWQLSAIKLINQEDVFDFLTKYASLNSAGTLEPHADWNQLMTSPAIDIQGLVSIFSGGGTFYPGDNFIVEFENGTVVELNWLAIYNNPNPTGPLTTGGDFYNYFVLGLLPESYDPTDAYNSAFAPGNAAAYNDTVSSWNYDSFGAYPNPDVHQSDLSISGTGVVTGYLLHDVDTAVLSMPTFDQAGFSVGNFTLASQEVIDNATASNLSKIIIDLQGNTGGTVLLAFDSFARFFPDIDPFAGSRRRSFDLADVLGNTLTPYWSNLSTDDAEYFYYAANEWVVADRLNAATGENFSSWSEYSGPISNNNDLFSMTERYNLSSDLFDAAAFDGWIPYGYTADNPAIGARPFDVKDIVILTDGLCSSTCALFVEMMTQAGVRSITAGGRPTTGPMQAASGSRGARIYSSDLLDQDISFAQSLNSTANTTFPQDRDDTGVYTLFNGFNLRDQVRDDDAVPLQFKYQAADCRIYYTLSNLYNMSRLWRDVATAMWTDPSLCVSDSTGYTNSSHSTAKAPPAPPKLPLGSLDPSVAGHIDLENNTTGGLTDGKTPVVRNGAISACLSNGGCADGQSICTSIAVACSKGPAVERKLCLPPCNKTDGNDSCRGANTFCDTKFKMKSKLATLGITSKQVNGGFSAGLWAGLCYPQTDYKGLGCPK